MLLTFSHNLHSGIVLGLWSQVALLLLSSAAFPLDKRKVSGQNPWAKPARFQISSAIFLVTMGVLLTQLQAINQYPGAGHTWQGIVTVIGWTMGIAMAVGNVLISLQALRGVQSHTNFSTPLNTGIFQMMGLSILAITLALAALLLVYLDPGTRWQWPAAVNAGARLGLAILLWGSLEGASMISRRQHLVGAPDSGDGLPLLNWSRTHGDLRIAHFFGIHAIQVLLVLGFLLSCTHLSQAIQVFAVAAFAMIYMAGCHTLFRRAVRGRSAFGVRLSKLYA